jgi:hypothetical protein
MDHSTELTTPRKATWWGAVVGLILALVAVMVMSAGCSLLLNLEECESDADCTTQAKPRCDDGICVP